MYAKLAVNNAKKSIKDYLIYFITITICVSLFYAFTSLSSSSNELITEKSFNFENLEKILKYSTYVITFILTILVAYVNKYMIKRRQKEFATHILLGAEQKSVALMFFIESLIIGILAIICGIGIGTLFSQVVTAIVYVTSNQEIVFSFKLYPDTILNTFIFFISMFVIIGVYNIRVLKRLKLIDMLNSNKKVEFQSKRSNKVYLAVFIISVILYSICGYFAFELINTSEDLSAVKEMAFTAISLVSFILGTYTLYYSLAYILIYIKEKCPNFKYEGTNLFLIGTLVAKIKTAPMLMATISITFLGALISFILTIILTQWSLGFLEYRIPYNIIISNEYSGRFEEKYSLEHIDEIPKLDYTPVVEYLDENNFNVEDYCQVEKYFIDEEDFYIRDIQNIPSVAIKLSDFNYLREMLGYSKVKLNENEFTTQWQINIEEGSKEEYLKENQTLEVNGKTLNISEIDSYEESLGESIYNIFSDNLIILPDKICEELTISGTDFFANTDNKLSNEELLQFELEFLPSWFEESNPEIIEKYNVKYPNGNTIDITGHLMHVNLKKVEVNEVLNIMISMRILGIYLGIVLLMISLTVLSLQQLADSIEHKDRFNVLNKLGVEDKEINKIILKQVAMYFIVPIAIAIVGFTIFIQNYYKMNEEAISSYIGNEGFIFSIITGALLMISVYACYFVGTYYTFKRNIK